MRDSRIDGDDEIEIEHDRRGVAEIGQVDRLEVGVRLLQLPEFVRLAGPHLLHRDETGVGVEQLGELFERDRSMLVVLVLEIA